MVRLGWTILGVLVPAAVLFLPDGQWFRLWCFVAIVAANIAGYAEATFTQRDF